MVNARLVAWAAASLALSGLPAALGAQVIERPVLSSTLQIALAARAQAACKAQGFDVVVALADASGTVRTLVSADGASQIAVQSATRKAHSAAWLGFPTSALAKVATEAPAFADFLKSGDPQVVMFAGGVPIRVRGALAGAIGVGGAPGPDIDEGCAKAALEALADQLK